jgi:lipopolysaccharide transport periplasmic protein LptA
MMTPLRFLLATSLAACLGAIAPAAIAQNTQSAQNNQEDPDTLVVSDTLSYDDIKKESVFTGNVVLTRGAMTLHSDRLTMREDADGFQHGTATVEGGKKVLLRQDNPEKFEVLEARGERAIYNGKTEEIEMIGKAIITRFICGKPFDNIQGERVVYKQKTETYQAFGGPNSAAPGGRVRSLATPRARADAAIAACRKQGSKN